MKRVGGLFDRIPCASNLAWAAWRASRGRREHPEVAAFLADLPRQTAEISHALTGGTFRFQNHRAFSVRDTKTRVIHAPSFRDRVVHHAIIAVIGSVLERGAIATSFACRAGLGHHRAVHAARRWGREASAFLKMDVEKYYDSVRHDILLRLLARRFRERRLLDLLAEVVAAFEVLPGRGLPIGALTSQYFGNFYLDGVDHFALETLKVGRYLRYMDDMLILGDLEHLLPWRRAFEGRLAELGLRLKRGGDMNACRLGIPWLGFTVYPDRLRLAAVGRRRLRRRWGRAERDHLRGVLSADDLMARARALFAHARCADDIAWRRTVVGFSRVGEALERPEPRHTRRILEQLGGELPFLVSQQEEAGQPQRQPGVSGLFAPRHGGQEPPDDVLSRASAISGISEDESSGRAPGETDIHNRVRGRAGEEKASPGAPPIRGES